MDNNALVLLVNENPAGIDSIRRALADQGREFRLQCAEDVPTALARIAGGGVNIVLLRLGPAESPEGDPLKEFITLRARAPKVLLVAVCDSADESLAERAMREGAAGYLIRETYDVDLLKTLRSVLGKTGFSPNSMKNHPQSSGRILACMGSKGGVGTTTVAINVASALAQDYSVILAEFHPGLGTLQHYCQPHRSVPDMARLLSSGHSAITGPEVEGYLWPYKNVPGLHVLFGPRNADHIDDIESEDALAILAVLTTLADCIVIDLPVSLSETNRAVINAAAALALVIDRDRICMQAAKAILDIIESWRLPTLVEAVIVNRTALVSPLPMSEINASLSVPVLGVIPPAPDLCFSAQNAGVPLVTFDKDSLVAASFSDLSQEISRLILGASTARAGTRDRARNVTRVGAG